VQATFPGPILRPSVFQLAWEPSTRTAFWTASHENHIEKATLFSLVVGPWQSGDAMKTQSDVSLLLEMDESAELGGTSVFTDWLDIEVDCSGAVYIAFYKKIVKYVSGVFVLLAVGPQVFCFQTCWCVWLQQIYQRVFL